MTDKALGWPGVCRFQTSSAAFACKLAQRSCAKLVAYSVNRRYLRIFQEVIEPWRARKLVKRYLKPTNRAFSKRQQDGKLPFGISAVDSKGRTIWIADAPRDGQHFVVRADEMLTACIEREGANVGRFSLDKRTRF